MNNRNKQRIDIFGRETITVDCVKEDADKLRVNDERNLADDPIAWNAYK